MKTKKINAILKGLSFTDKLFSIKEKQIRNNLARANDDVDMQIVEMEERYENLLSKLGEKDVDYKYVINQLVEVKSDMQAAYDTLEYISSITTDLDSEVEVEKEEKKR